MPDSRSSTCSQSFSSGPLPQHKASSQPFPFFLGREWTPPSFQGFVFASIGGSHSSNFDLFMCFFSIHKYVKYFFSLINDTNNIIVKTLSATDQSYYYISHLSQNHLNTSASSISNYSSGHLILASFLNHLLTHHLLTSLITYTFPNSKDFVHSSSFLTSPKSYLVNHTLLLKSVISLALLASPSP